MRRNTFAVTLLIAAVAACGTVREPQCPDVKLAAVAVHALDAETGRAVVDRRVRAVARDGEYVDQGTADHGIAPLALDRAGTYHVHVEAPGYQPWTRQGVNVTRGRCAVLPAIVKARLHRWPDPDTMPEFASVVTETVEVPARRRPIQGSPEWERRLNWILEPTPVALTFRIRHGPEPGRIGVSTTLVNLGEPLNTGHSLRRELTWGMCDFVLRAHRSADLKGEPAWDSWTWARPPSRRDQGGAALTSASRRSFCPVIRCQGGISTGTDTCWTFWAIHSPRGATTSRPRLSFERTRSGSRPGVPIFGVSRARVAPAVSAKGLPELDLARHLHAEGLTFRPETQAVEGGGFARKLRSPTGD